MLKIDYDDDDDDNDDNDDGDDDNYDNEEDDDDNDDGENDDDDCAKKGGHGQTAVGHLSVLCYEGLRPLTHLLMSALHTNRFSFWVGQEFQTQGNVCLCRIIFCLDLSPILSFISSFLSLSCFFCFDAESDWFTSKFLSLLVITIKNPPPHHHIHHHDHHHHDHHHHLYHRHNQNDHQAHLGLSHRMDSR